MIARTHELAFKGALLARGFWLYVWEITPPEGPRRYYVGRTGDSSSLNAQSPFARLSQHLGSNERSSALRKHLTHAKLDPKTCQFRLVCHGPILPEKKEPEAHRRSRDIVAAFEKALRDGMEQAGYKVLNIVDCKVRLDEVRYASIREAFAVHFPNLEPSRVQGG